MPTPAHNPRAHVKENDDDDDLPEMDDDLSSAPAAVATPPVPPAVKAKVAAKSAAKVGCCSVALNWLAQDSTIIRSFTHCLAGRRKAKKRTKKNEC